MDNESKQAKVVKEASFPFFLKASIILMGTFVFFAMLIWAKSILIPLVLAFIISTVLHPIVNFLVSHKFHRVLAIVITLLMTILVAGAIVVMLVHQVSRFSESWPLFVDKITQLLNEITATLSGYYDINPLIISDWISKLKAELLNNSTVAIGQTLFALGNLLMVLFLIPVYVFLILFYNKLLVEFVHRLFGAIYQVKVTIIVSQVKNVVQRYLIGLVMEALIVGSLNTLALALLGIEFAILLGVVGALLNVIPYIGGLVAVALPMMVALATESSPWSAVYVLIAYYLIQLVDNNIIVPWIVSSKVKINALFSIIVVIVGNAFWGIPGMFLSIPLLAIVKLICDNIESLKPWGFLLGDTMTKVLIIKPLIKKIKSNLHDNH